MGRKPGQTRQRMVGAAVELLRERGASAVTVDAVLAAAAPARFGVPPLPGGRNELVLAAVRHAADYVTSRIDATVESGDPVQALDGFVRFWKKTLRDTDYLAGCPSSPSRSTPIRIRRKPPRWPVKSSGGGRPSLPVCSSIAASARPRHTSCHLDGGSCRGAVILCRARRDHTPLDDVRNELKPCLRAPGLATRGRWRIDR
ncbi:tetR-family transcriptional regulator [Mycobacterium xenopi 4042]|uniref:TetR-family transcriptional regulator n=1 Tax=Mycobacterium xenopi 4042 TaxID=1299334 RepID=X8BF19_MYCXE|nr:tetR-family transcriptional regulator [Mycobacterium xenopi 4042]